LALRPGNDDFKRNGTAEVSVHEEKIFPQRLIFFEIMKVIGV